MKALTVAKKRWGEPMQINDGFTFVDLENKAIVYMFAVYKSVDKYPSEVSITNQVAAARMLRLVAEKELQMANDMADYDAMQQAQQKIELGWKQILDEEHFGTVVVSATAPHQPVEVYSGLPLNYVSLPDAEDIARDRFNGINFSEVRFIFTGLFGYYAVFECASEKCAVNLKKLEIEDEQPVQEENFSAKDQHEKAKNETMPHWLLAEDPPFEYIISGVPDYQSYCSMCAQHAAGNVLGYWDDNGYPLLINGSNDEVGDESCNNPSSCQCGWKYLCRCELKEEMNYYGCGVGTEISSIDEGIEAVCYLRAYNFQSVQSGPKWPADQYNFIRSEIRAGRPFVYTLRYPTYGGPGGGYHSVTLIGYDADVIDSKNYVNHHEKSSSMEPETVWFYICHDDNSSTGVDVYLYWSQFTGKAYIHTVVPGVCLNLLQTANASLNSCSNHPNPFNQKTAIQFYLSSSAQISISITNLFGEIVRTYNLGLIAEGAHQVFWTGTDESGNAVASGVYYYTIHAGNSRMVGKALLIK